MANLILILTLLGALVAFAREVLTDYDRSTDFSLCRTYSWIHVKAPAFWEDRITRAPDTWVWTPGRWVLPPRPHAVWVVPAFHPYHGRYHFCRGHWR